MAASLVMPCVAVLLGIVAAPGRAHASTVGAVIVLLIGTAIVVSNTWMHAQPVASLRQELYDINHPAHPAGPATGTAWQQWTANGDRADAHGRVLAVFWLSAAVTGVILYAWFA